jgi:DNA repair protein RadA/Sms
MKTKYYCTECGHESIKWLGKCPGCAGWNTFTLAKETVPAKFKHRVFKSETRPQVISEIKMDEKRRQGTGIGEFDRVLGGGLVPGSVVLVGGDPGIGKSTLLLQVSNNLSNKYGVVLYVSGEESLAQTKLRAQRLGVNSSQLHILATTSVEEAAKYIDELKPKSVVVDSIQAVYKSDLTFTPGSIVQLKESTAELLYLAKGKDIPIFLIGHMTKGGVLAGPKVLEHMVDAVLYFEGDKEHSYRILRAVKNRFGSTNEVGIFEMKIDGLAEVKNPSRILLEERTEDTSGSCITATLEGSRPLLVEIQALVSPSSFNLPQRRTTGLDYNRTSLLLAVLEKRTGLKLGNKDVFLNVAGGLRICEPAVDLAMVLAVTSGLKNKTVKPGLVAMGEVGLSGEVRSINQIALRIREAEKLGFKECIIPKGNLKDLKKRGKIKVSGVAKIGEALRIAL